ncbi:PspA-associated protein PspAA [Nocardia vaccinii]|uniref:PspA-associated protein PspAA n=1 Tax=Nocardia vaccinii TaxID=1822 RepID=UPI0008308FD0|nr:hypothetical protein [Nocardia vaccinii]
MIVQILGEGRYRVTEIDIAELEALDAQLLEAADAAQDIAFTGILDRMRKTVRHGEALIPGIDMLAPDLVLPAADTSPSEIRAMLQDEGLIPGH